MISSTLSLADVNELEYLAVFSALVVLGGLLAGLANFFISDRGRRPTSGLMRELLIGVVCAITIPLFLTLLSSSLMSSPKLALLDFLRLFSVVVGYTMIIRRLFSGSTEKPSGEHRAPSLLSFIEVEILRSVEANPVAHNALPQLAPDLRISSSKVGERVRWLMQSGFLGIRADQSNQGEMFVTAAGWTALNKTLQHGVE